MSNRPLFSAACLIVLPEKLSSKETEQHQILNGMCKVLELQEDEVCLAWVKEELKAEEGELVAETIAKWAPYSVLIMGEVLAQNLLKNDAALDNLRTNFQTLPGVEAIVQVTYHPKELQHTKVYKRKAYEDLLRLKEYLALVRKL